MYANMNINTNIRYTLAWTFDFIVFIYDHSLLEKNKLYIHTSLRKWNNFPNLPLLDPLTLFSKRPQFQVVCNIPKDILTKGQAICLKSCCMDQHFIKSFNQNRSLKDLSKVLLLLRVTFSKFQKNTGVQTTQKRYISIY